MKTTHKKGTRAAAAPAAAATDNKERLSKEKGTTLQPSSFSVSSVKDLNKNNVASIKMDQSSNHKVPQKPSSSSTKIGNQTAKKEPANGSMHFTESASVSAPTCAKKEPANGSMHFTESASVSAPTFSTDPYQMSFIKNVSVPVSHYSENEVNKVADDNFNDSASPPASSHNRMNATRAEFMSSENPSLAEMAAMEDTPSNEQYHSCSSSDQSTLEGEEYTSDQANTNESMSNRVTAGVTRESHLDKIASSSPSSSCAPTSQNSFKIDQLNIPVASKAPQTASLEAVHSKITNNQFQSCGDEKQSVADQSASNSSPTPDVNRETMKEDGESTIFSNAKVPVSEFEVDPKQFKHIDSTISDPVAIGRHLTPSLGSVFSTSEKKHDQDNRFLTVLDINLRTVPCKVPPPARPPPSRPPPKPASLQGHTGPAVQMKNMGSVPSETEILIETSKGGQTDVEDASSAAAASNAIKEAMEQAVAKIKIAKEMERKKDNLQYRKKLGKSHSIQEKERGVNDAPQLAQLSGVDQSIENLSHKSFDTVSEDKTNTAYSDVLAPESELVKVMKQNAHDEVANTNPVSSEKTGTWKIEEQFFELVNSDISFKKVKEISDNTSQKSNESVRVVDGELKESEAHVQMHENDRNESPDADMACDLLEVSKSYSLEKNTDSVKDYQVPPLVKKTDEDCSTRNSDGLVSGIEDVLEEETSSCQDKENEVLQKNQGDSSELEIPTTDKTPHLYNASEDMSKPSRDNAYAEMVSKVDSNENQSESVHQVHQSDVDDCDINSSETNCKIDIDDMNLNPEPVELPDDTNSKEVEMPSISRVRKKWDIPKFSGGSILATEEACDQGEKEQVSETDMVTEPEDSNIFTGNLEACENILKDPANIEGWEHKSDAVEEPSTYPNADQENVTGEVIWQHFCEKIIRENDQDEPKHSGEKQEAADVDSKSNIVEEVQVDAQGCCKTGMEGESASSFQDAGIKHSVVADASQSAEDKILVDGVEGHSYSGNMMSSPEETPESQSLEGTVKKLQEMYRTDLMQEERVFREDELKRDAVKKLEEERERERQRKLEVEREREMERKLEEEREREREREKDRQAAERAIRESRERAERAAVERVTAEARQRALAEAREKAEKASAEALLQAEKASREARLRAERAAVERATAEARERAVERALAEKAALEAKERLNGTSREWNKREGSVEGTTKYNLKDEHIVKRSVSSSDLQESSRGTLRYSYSSNSVSYATDKVGGNEGESAIRSKARLERHQRTVERAAKALAEKNMRDILAQKEQAERNRLAESLDVEVRRWSSGKEGNLRALLSTLQYILGPESGWQPVPLTEVITAAAVKKAYRKATLCVHPDKLQQRGATIQQKYICEKVFDLLKEAWNRFNSEER